MSDHVVDTNVLLVASAADPFSPFGDSDLPADLQGVVLEWLAELRGDQDRQMVWDSLFRVYDEYRNKLTDQDYGLLVVKEKMATARFVEVSYGPDGEAVVPEAFARFDRSDKKLLAVALADRGASSLVNATDTDWLSIEDALVDAGVTVEQLIEDWLRAKHHDKQKKR